MEMLRPLGLCILICCFYQGVVVSENPNQGDARLVDGGVPNQGRVEIYINSSWWSVCSYWFSYSAARVVCQNLGQPEPSNVYYNGDSFGQGNGSILTQQYDCYGNESSVLNCTKRGDYDYYCGHSRDVGIACGPLVLAECSHLLTEPSGHISFKRGEKISETQCQWTIGNISHPNGESVVLVYDPDKYDYCSFAVSILDGFGNIIFEKYCAPPLPRSIFDSSSLGVTVKVRARNKYRTFNFEFHYAILNGSIDSASQVDGWNVTAVDASQTSITIQWPKLTNVFGNLIRSYIVVVESTYGEKVAGNIVSPNFTSIEVDGLNTTTEYRVFAVVLDDLGRPFRSSPVLTSTEEGVPSRSPYVQYTILGVDSIHLSISPIPEQHHNGKLLGYIILYRASCYLLNSSGQVNVSVSTTSYTLNGLLPGTKYEIRVAAFTSKGTGQYHHINVFTTCEGQRTLTERNGTLHSPNYPCAYGGVQYCRWTIKPQLSGNAVKAIWIKFKTFDVGRRGVFHCELGDWLSVKAGENGHADNDTLICDYVRPFSFVVPGDVTEIAFRTHNSYSYSSGFFASYIGLQDTFIDIPLSSWHLSVYNITSSSLRVEWEDFPLNISISKFMVMFTQENKNISVLFEVNSLYDRYYDIKHLIKPYRMYKFHVLACTGSIENETYSTEIKTILTGEGECGAAVHNSSGVIQSPGYPQGMEYSQCTWDIDPGARNKSVLVTFQHFNLPLSYECKEFFVSVRDESGIKPELLCVENKPFIFLARKLRIEYRSNRYTNSWTGFEAHYVVLNESIVNAPLVDNWNINITSVQSSSISVVWAHYVPDNHYSLHFYAVICTPITSESGPIVVIANTTQTDIEVRRLRGLTEYTVQVLALTIHPDSVSLSLKGSQKLVITTTEGVPSEPPGNVTAMSSDASAITVSWSHIQNDSVNGMLLGYMVFYKSLYDDGNYSTNTVGPSTLQVIISEHLIYTDIYEIKVAGITGAGVGVMSKSMVVRPGCIGLIHEKMGTVTSPGFPNNYPSDLVCYWIWRPTLTKYRFALAFDTFRTEDVEGRPNCTNFKNDHIQVGIVNVKWNPLPYCGIRNPFALILEGNTTDPARMLFRSNGGLEGQGFNASYFIVSKTSKISVNILDGSIKGHEVSLTLLPANDASGIKEYIVFYKPSKLKHEWKFKRTTQTQITLRSLKGLTEYTVTIVGYTSSKETYGSQDLKFKTLEATEPETTTASVTTPTPVNINSTAFVNVNESKSVVINCTFESGTPTWTRQDGGEVETTTRKIKNGVLLEIKKASIADTGVYVCTNGGNTHKITVQVLVEVKVEMALVVLNYGNFTEDLEDNTTLVYKATEKNFTTEMDKVHKGHTPGYVKTIVLKFSEGSVKVDFQIVIILVTNNPKNATTIADKKAEAAQRVVVRAKKGAVERLRVKAVIVKTVPLEPENVEIFGIDSDELSVRWQPSEDADAFEVSEYLVQHRAFSEKVYTNFNQRSSKDKTQYSYRVKPLEPETTYMVRVAAINKYGHNFNEESSHQTDPAPFAWWIILVVVLIILFVLGLLVGVILYRRKRGRERELAREEEPRFNALQREARSNAVALYEEKNVKGLTLSFTNDAYKPSELNWEEIPYENLKLLNELGSGAFGIVYKGELLQDNGNVTDCAVKALKPSATNEEIRDLYNELEIMTNVGYHPNLVNLIGACTEDGHLLVVLEIAENGSLLEFLKKSRQTDQSFENINCGLTEQMKTKIATDVARGMAHLATCRCIHRDLAARNVLLGADYVAKVSDYGMARDVYEQLMYKKETQGKLPVKWMAIESLETYIFTIESDVWAYGVLLWEMESGGLKPYAGLNTTELIAELKKGYRMEKPNGCSDEMYQVMRDCWNPNPKARPTFEQLVIRLGSKTVA